MEPRSEEDLQRAARKIIREYDESIEQALQERDAKIRQLKTSGSWKQADLIRATGYSRETIRQALNPEIRAAVKARRTAKETTEES